MSSTFGVRTTQTFKVRPRNAKIVHAVHFPTASGTVAGGKSGRRYTQESPHVAGLRSRLNSTSILYFLYQLVQVALSPLLGVFLLYRCVQDRRYFNHLSERFGFLPGDLQSRGGPSLWIHAVSVGEVLSAVPLLRQIRAQRPYSRVYLSTTTLTGRAMAKERLMDLVDGVFYAPLDYRSCVRRVLRRLRPSVVVILETEIWPNLYREAKGAGAALVVVNGRISDSTLPTYLKWKWFFTHVLAQPDRILTQSEQDRARYISAGAPSDRVTNAGNMKYDFQPPGPVAPDLDQFLDRVWPEVTWIAASTMTAAVDGDPDEEDAVIAAFADLARRHSRLLMVLVPRKPERFDFAAQKLARAGISFVRRSALSNSVVLPGVLLLDSMGELAPLFARASAVFMGGTLASRGGHNILEPAYFAKAVVAGPHMENFAAMAEEFTAAGALARIASAEELAPAVDHILTNPEEADTIGLRAQSLANSKRGVVERIAAAIFEQAALALPSPRRTLLARLFLTPLSWLWLAGHKINLGRQLASQARLKTRVISIGGLSMGGVGKSPLVAHLAARFAEAGSTAAILTRGYGREATEPVVIVPRGGSADIDLTGDEAQVYVGRGIAHVGVSSDRYAAGLRMEQELHPSVFLMDDGFQHVKLARDRDVVLIDALDPLAGGIFPLGRRREPLESLKRASAVVITRTEPGVSTLGIERLIQRYHPGVPIFRSRVVPREWVDFEWGTSRPVNETAARKVAAFCGLGSPAAFWQTLESLGLQVVFRWAFGDHHRYSPADLRRVAHQAAEAGAEAIVTTEKDVMNLCPDVAQLIAPQRLYWLRIGLEIENEKELLELLL
jgi:tetraacyldisaccharide 4'-kinase